MRHLEHRGFSYDFRNRLTNVEVGGTVVATYVYDALNRRIGIDDNGSQTWTVYDGTNAYADFNGSGTLKERYLYGPAVDELLARTSSGGDTAWYISDKDGSVQVIYDASAGVVDTIIYDSFGQVVTETGASSGDRFKYAGMEYDSAIQIYYDQARNYNPATGRFLQQDPLGLAAGDVNVYRYVGNNPATLTDPSGLRPAVAQGTVGSSAPPSSSGGPGNSSASDPCGCSGTSGLDALVGSLLPAPAFSNLLLTDPDADVPVRTTQFNPFTDGDVQFTPLQQGMTPDHNIPQQKPSKVSEYEWNSAVGAYLKQAFESNAELAKIGVAGAPFEAAVGGIIINQGWARQTGKDMSAVLGRPALEIQNAVQHAYWLAMLYLQYGEAVARKLAWIHEKYASDGWRDSLRDLYNNNRGIEIGKVVEKMLGPDGMRRIREDTSPAMALNARELAAPAELMAKARQLVEAQVLEALQRGNLVVPERDVDDNRATVMPDILRDAQRLWDGDIYYMPFGGRRLTPGIEVKPKDRPCL